jgi:hypothetical protein
MVWVGYEIVSSVAGLPRAIGPILAASAAMLVVVDPLHLFWPRHEGSSDVPLSRAAPSFDRKASSYR